jgi:hypothetical protein
MGGIPASSSPGAVPSLKLEQGGPVVQSWADFDMPR